MNSSVNDSVWVTLKLASSIDGRIATAGGESRWITGQPARERVHQMRSEHDAVLVGANTAIRDDPELTVRLPGYSGKQPARVVLDTHQRLPLTSCLVRTAHISPVIVVTALKPSQALIDAGVTVLQVPAQEAGMDVPQVLEAICKQGYSKLFVEGGGRVAASFIRAGVVDRLEWFRAPLILGGEGKAAIGELHVEGLAQAMRFRRVDCAPIGDDLWERYERPL